MTGIVKDFPFVLSLSKYETSFSNFVDLTERSENFKEYMLLTNAQKRAAQAA